jgi:PPE-repeat protein
MQEGMAEVAAARLETAYAAFEAPAAAMQLCQQRQQQLKPYVYIS